VVLYEVYKALRRQTAEESADEAALQLTRHVVIPLDADVALAAAEASLARNLPLAAAVIYATADLHEARLVTSDQHFRGLDGVHYIPKP
jgi:predicted nucleic acid-binding protein